MPSTEETYWVTESVVPSIEEIVWLTVQWMTAPLDAMGEMRASQTAHLAGWITIMLSNYNIFLTPRRFGRRANQAACLRLMEEGIRRDTLPSCLCRHIVSPSLVPFLSSSSPCLRLRSLTQPLCLSSTRFQSVSPATAPLLALN